MINVQNVCSFLLFSQVIRYVIYRYDQIFSRHCGSRFSATTLLSLRSNLIICSLNFEILSDISQVMSQKPVFEGHPEKIEFIPFEF